MTLSRKSRDRLLAAIAQEVDKQQSAKPKATPKPKGQSPVDSQALGHVLDDMMHATGEVPSNA